jgi:protein O-GlcNAc transferase
VTESNPTAIVLDTLLRRARTALAADNLALAEALAQEILRLKPDDGVGWAIMAHVAALIGREDEAVRWGKQANPDVLSRFERPKHDKVTALLAGCGAGSDEERFILIKAWGYGFWSDVFHVLGALMLAELTGRQPCVLWGANSLYLPDGQDNAWPLFFNGVGSELMMFLKAAPAEEIFPRKWHAAGPEAPEADKRTPPHKGGEGIMAALWLLNRPERVVVSDFHIGMIDLMPWIPESHPWHGLALDAIVRQLVERYLLPSWSIRDLVAEQMATLEGRSTVAVHIRGADKALEVSKLAEVNAHYPAVVEQAVSKNYAVWLMTDSKEVVDEYRGRFGSAIYSLEALRTETDQGVHHTVEKDDRRRLGQEVVTDVLVGASCDRFIGNGASNPSSMVDFLMEGDETRKHLFLPNHNRRRFLSLYRD